MTSVSYGPRSQANARLLIDTAVSLGYPSSVVKTTVTGYRVPDDVLEAALGVGQVHEGVQYPPPSQVPAAAPDKPRGNASRDAFAEYAQTVGLPITEAMSRNDIRNLVNGKE
jgi:hypothetical protein